MEEPKTEKPEDAAAKPADLEPPEQIKQQLDPADSKEEEKLPEHVTEQPLPQTEQLILPPKSHRQKYLAAAIIVLLAAIGATAYLLTRSSTPKASTNTTQSNTAAKQTSSTTTAAVKGLQLDSAKNYGNKYADGVLPVGDNQYSTTTPKVGQVYVCANYAKNLAASQGGAMTRGPWFVGTTQWNVNKKLHVQGAVTWQASFSNKVSGGTRTIITNDLPDHTTGVFPISPSDPAYAYDRNPNSIKGQTFTYSLTAAPSYGDPTCVGGQVGIMLTGVALFSAFDAGGRDAGAWEVQDSCNGHPQSDGIYHYHTLSSCIKDTSVKTVIGYALDGFPITGPKVGDNNYLTTADLDECHGLTSQIVLDGKTVTSYHYVMTQDFPYSVSCYRAAAIEPPGQNAAAQGPRHP